MLLVGYSAVLVAQDKADAPKPLVLTDVQKLQILNAAKDLEIAQLRLDAARLAMQTLIASVTPAGYQINSQLALEPLPAPVKEKP